MQATGNALRVPAPRRGGSGVPEARALMRQGRLTEALGALATLSESRLTEDDLALARAARVECLLARGELTAAMLAGDQLTPLLQRPSYAGAVAQHARAELAAAMGEFDVALEGYLAVGSLPAWGDHGPDGDRSLPWRCGAALVLLHLGRGREAALLAREQVDAARGSAYDRALALRTLATADVTVDRVATLRLALDALEPVRADRLAAQIGTDLAGLLLLSPAVAPAQLAEAVRLLRAAERYAGRQELWPLQGRVRRLLERVGEDPQPVQSEAMAALTAGERRVARLAAEGLTNRQIAAQLVITVKAVEWHLSHVYRKLGIRSRTRLASALGLPA
ncbi:LuxR family transcriptional regulator [Nocardioides ferulae]|uniref:LuxR family transcriptional regulator n=1 Tax=Nocardioides ferulae TaxID=2340821 RepID=UPI000EB3945D|nr:LuxR family transcriptional regulator [Nocardioides ferulae]